MTKKVIYMLLLMVLLPACTTTTSSPNTGNLKKAAEYNASLGSQYLNAGELKKARAKLLKALDQDSENAEANFSYGLLLSRVKQAPQAETYFLKAIKLAPDETYYQDTFGIFLCRLDRFDEANTWFIQAANNPYNETPEYAYNNAGSCALSQGKRLEAEESIRQALRKNPRFAPALLNMAELSLDLKKYRIAKAYYSRALKYTKQTADSLWLGVKINRLLGDRRAVDNYGLMLKRDFPQSQETLLYLESKQL